MVKHCGIVFLLILGLLISCEKSEPDSGAARVSKGAIEWTLASEADWGSLNPARGNEGPGAATLWGDRTSNVASGILVRFKEGFASPPHIHNITYRGLVISGLLHNDDPDAASMWLPPGSFWTQPAGEVHITSAKGVKNLAYIEIDHGPYLVMPTDSAFDNGERPVNVDQSNLVWLNASDIKWIEDEKSGQIGSGVQVAFIWGERQKGKLNGTLIKFPEGFRGKIETEASEFRAIAIEGKLQYFVDDEESAKEMEPGSYFGSEGRSVHVVANHGGESVIYIRTNRSFEITSTKLVTSITDPLAAF